MRKITITPAQIIALREAEMNDKGQYAVSTAKQQTVNALVRAGIVVGGCRLLTVQGVSVMHSVRNVEVIASKGFRTSVLDDAEGLEPFTARPVTDVLASANDDRCGGDYELCSLASKGKSCDCAGRPTDYEVSLLSGFSAPVAAAERMSMYTHSDGTYASVSGPVMDLVTLDEPSVEITGEYIEHPDAFGHMAEQEAERIAADGGCVGLCAVGTGCAHCDEQYGPEASQTDAESVSPAEIQKDREVYAEWERELLTMTDSLPVVPSPVKCQDCLTNEATIFDMDAPSCDECERKYAAMNNKTIPTVNVVQAHMGMNGMNHYHAPGCRDIARESKRHGARKGLGVYEFAFTSVADIIEHEYSDVNNGVWADMLAHANDDFDGLRIMPCLSIPAGRTDNGPLVVDGNFFREGFDAPSAERVAEIRAEIDAHECDDTECITCIVRDMNQEGDAQSDDSDAGFVETLVTMEYDLSVIVDDSTGATVDLGWVTLTMNDAQKYDLDRVAEEYGRTHGEGTPRHGWASIILVNGTNAL